MQLIRKCQKGFSLVEVSVGMLIFLIGFTGVSSMLLSTVKGTAFSGNFTEAVVHATNKLESLQTLSFSDIDLTDKQSAGQPGYGLDGLDLTGTDVDGNDSSLGRNGMFDLYWNVAEDAPAQKSKTVAVIVQWSDKGVLRNVSMQGLLTE